MYAQDYDDKLPPAIFPGKTVGWANGLQPYLKSTQIFQCPEEKNDQQKIRLIDLINRLFVGSGATHQNVISAPDKPEYTDYWLNRNLSGLDSSKLELPDFVEEQIIMLGDGDGESPQSTASYSINQLPEPWRTSSNSPARRHLDGANYAFLDGHVKWLKPEQIAQVPPSKKSQFYTFLLK
jgi:prepilin-type processing-associated H-X9-DG protein